MGRPTVRPRPRSRRPDTRLAPMTTTPDDRPYSPGLQGVLAGETSLSLVDGDAGRLLYRGYAIGELVREGTFAKVAELLWTGRLARRGASALRTARRSRRWPVCATCPPDAHPMDALRTAVSVWGAGQRPTWPPTRRAGTRHHGPGAVGTGGLRPAAPGPRARRARSSAGHRRRGFLYQLTGDDAGRGLGARPGRLLHRRARSTASTPRRSRRASSPRPARTSPAPSSGPSARSRARSTAAPQRRS